MISLVTGASGFLGSFLVDALLARGDTVVALQRKPVPERDRLLAIEGTVTDADALARAVGENAPQQIFHLAAQSLPQLSWTKPWATHCVNVGGTVNLLEAVRSAGIAPTVVIASSSSIYAQSVDGAPISEADPCQPSSPYGVSKLAADHLGRLYAHRHGMRVMLARPFFLIGPRKTGDVCSDWARKLVAIEQRKTMELAVGNLEAVRDFLHVADGVAGLLKIADCGRAGEAYNVCAGRGWRLGDILNVLSTYASVPITVRSDAALFRPLDERAKVGNPLRLQALGWRETRGVEAALLEILQYWRAQS